MYNGPSTSGDYIDSHGEHYGHLDSRNYSYAQTMLGAGMASISAGSPVRVNYDVETAAQNQKAGLWSSCPGFGR